MDIIDDSTFEYKSFDVQSINIGGFDWSLQFMWIGISDREKNHRKSDIAPARYTGDFCSCLYSPKNSRNTKENTVTQSINTKRSKRNKYYLVFIC